MFHCDICGDLVEDEDMCSCEERGESVEEEEDET